MRLLTNRKGLSPVVATIILCGVVLTVGISVWSWTYAITSGLQSDYYEGVKRQIDAVSERFIVEHIGYDDITHNLDVWIYNYGEIDVQVDVYAKGNAEGSTAGTTVAHGTVVRVRIPLVLAVGNELSITVMSRRQNFVYATHIVTAS